jgi:hypothetical protein
MPPSNPVVVMERLPDGTLQELDWSHLQPVAGGPATIVKRQ